MKRYAVFKGSDYYPIGGWGDFVQAFETLEEARAELKRPPVHNWSHIVDLQELREVD